MDATHICTASGSSRLQSRRRHAKTVPVLALFVLLWLAAPSALAGQAATGELAFHPCTQCHPVTVDAEGVPSHPLPIGLKKHEVVLEVHDVLGTNDAACLACHDDPSRNPGKLVLPDRSLVDITGDVSRVCQTCHMEKYREWTVGVHGKDAPKCTAAGCHDPHTPSYIYMAALPPFQGTGVQIKAVGSEREPFKPLAGPPLQPEVYTPTWLLIVAAFGAAVSTATVAYLVHGRVKR